MSCTKIKCARSELVSKETSKVSAGFQQIKILCTNLDQQLQSVICKIPLRLLH